MSGLQSFLAFCKLHYLKPNPAPDTLSLFIAYMAKQKGPSGNLILHQTINSYLSGIAHYLEPYFAEMRATREHPLVVKTLCGARKIDGHSVTWKQPIEDHHLTILT